MKGKVYLIGAGPGDPKLITLKAVERLRNANCVIYDHLVNPEILKHAAAECEIIYAGKSGGEHTLSQDEINSLLVKKARDGKVVARLKGGDPFIFGRGSEEAQVLAKTKVPFEIISGVTSAIAVPTYAGIPLTDRKFSSTCTFITGQEDPSKRNSAIDWRNLSESKGTLVFLMGVANLKTIADSLTKNGKDKDTPVAIITWGTLPKQKTFVSTLKDVVKDARREEIKPPSIIVVGDVVRLRRTLNWFERKPLFGNRIIVTRTREQASFLSEKLSALGAEVVEIPTIKIVSLKPDRQLREAFSRSEFDRIFFTSQNGVSEFAEFLERCGKDSRIFGKAKICAIGPETAKGLRSIGIKADFVPKQFVAEAIVKKMKLSLRGAFSATKQSKKEIAPSALILRAKKARDVLPDGLKEAGFKVRVIDLYDTVIPKEGALMLKEALKERIDFITFTSSSTVDNFIKLLGKDYKRKLSGIKFASIGPVTSATLKKHGLKAVAEAKVYTIEGLVKAIIHSSF